MSQFAPEKIRLIPDEWHIHHVGQLENGRLFFVAPQLDYQVQPTKDFACTFLFDTDGCLVEHTIDLVGTRGTYSNDVFADVMKRHINALGSHTKMDIWVRPFQIESYGTKFGLIVRPPEEVGLSNDDASEWRVEFMPGNTLSFYPPWEAGGYDT